MSYHWNDVSWYMQCNIHDDHIFIQNAEKEMKKKKVDVIVHSFNSQLHKPDCHCMICPNCEATEVDDCSKPIEEWKWQIKPFKVDNMSHCLKCDSWF